MNTKNGIGYSIIRLPFDIDYSKSVLSHNKVLQSFIKGDAINFNHSQLVLINPEIVLSVHERRKIYTILAKLVKETKIKSVHIETDDIFILQASEGMEVFDAKKAKHFIVKKGLCIESIYNMYFGGNQQHFSFKIEQLFQKFYILLRKVKRSEASNKELKKFAKVIEKLNKKGEAVQIIVSRELHQAEQQVAWEFIESIPYSNKINTKKDNLVEFQLNTENNG